MHWSHFKQIRVMDFEFQFSSGGLPRPVAMVAYDIVTGIYIRWGPPELVPGSTPPFPMGDDTLVVTFFGSAEMGCFLALGWPMPRWLLDLYAEFRWLTSGRELPLVGEPAGRRRRSRHSLLAALSYFGLDGIAAIEKEAMRQLAMRGGPYTPVEVQQLLDYCQTDVDSSAKLFERMRPHLDLPRALLRGRYVQAVARMEWIGVPVDKEMLAVLWRNWEPLKADLVSRVDAVARIYAGGSFNERRWASYVGGHGIHWPQLPGGRLALDEDTFRDMAKAFPGIVGPYHELRATLSRLRLNDLAVGDDGRNRVLLSPFASKTGRNQPSNSQFIFGPAVWIRGLIRPARGMAVAYVDWEQQEFGIAAALSGDVNMMAAYRSGDPYLTFGQQAGVIPPWGTKQTHAAAREQLKVCALSVQFGAEAASIAARLGVPIHRGQELLDLHRRTYPRFWEWSQAAQDVGVLTGRLQSAFGWQVHVEEDFNPRSIRNFPCQANGAEMLRLACIFATEASIRVCAPVHDALLIEASADDIDAVVAKTQQHMRRASELVLPGFPLRTDAKVVRWPDRYMDPRGAGMWQTVQTILAELPPTPDNMDVTPSTGAASPPAPMHPPSSLVSPH